LPSTLRGCGWCLHATGEPASRFIVRVQTESALATAKFSRGFRADACPAESLASCVNEGLSELMPRCAISSTAQGSVDS
jgi:hypothetical protein